MNETQRVKALIADLRKIMRIEKQIPFDQAPTIAKRPDTVPLSKEDVERTTQKIEQLKSIEMNKAINKSIVENTEESTLEAKQRAQLVKELGSIRDVRAPDQELPLYDFREEPDFDIYKQYVDLFSQVKGISKADSKSISDMLDNSASGIPPTPTQLKRLNKVAQVLRDLELKLTAEDLPAGQRDQWWNLRESVIPSLQRFLDELPDLYRSQVSQRIELENEGILTYDDSNRDLLVSILENTDQSDNQALLEEVISRLKKNKPIDNTQLLTEMNALLRQNRPPAEVTGLLTEIRDRIKLQPIERLAGITAGEPPSDGRTPAAPSTPVRVSRPDPNTPTPLRMEKDSSPTSPVPEGFGEDLQKGIKAFQTRKGERADAKRKAEADARKKAEEAEEARRQSQTDDNDADTSAPRGRLRQKGNQSAKGIGTGFTKLDKSGRFGALQIDMSKLAKMQLVAKKWGRIVAKGTMSPDLFMLLTKRFNPKHQYTQQALDEFCRLVELADLPTMDANCGKGKLLKQKKSNTKSPTEKTRFIYYDSTDELVERLELIVGEIRAGNNNSSLVEEGTHLADILKSKGIIGGAEYERLLSQML